MLVTSSLFYQIRYSEVNSAPQSQDICRRMGYGEQKAFWTRIMNLRWIRGCPKSTIYFGYQA